MLLVAATGVLLTTGYASAETAQQEKMKTCDAEASQKGLKGEERKAFMSKCLSAGSAAAPKNTQQEKMKTCNADAKAKNLKGADREAFMKRCLPGK
jgi:hypothetical protein